MLGPNVQNKDKERRDSGSLKIENIGESKKLENRREKWVSISLLVEEGSNYPGIDIGDGETELNIDGPKKGWRDIYLKRLSLVNV